MLEKTLDNVTRREGVILGVPILIAIVRWDLVTGDFSGLIKLSRYGGELYVVIAVIGYVRPLFGDALVRDYSLGMR